MKIPTFFSKKVSQEKNMQKFLKFVEDQTIYTEAEDEKTGWERINEAKKSVKLDEILKNVDDYASDKIIALIAIAQEENLSDKELLASIFDSLYVETSSGYGGEDYAFRAPVKEEIEVDLHKFPGKLDTKEYPDIYAELEKLLDARELEKILSYNPSDIEKDIMYVSIPKFYWVARIDENKLQDSLVKKLDMTEQEIEHLAKVGTYD